MPIYSNRKKGLELPKKDEIKLPCLGYIVKVVTKVKTLFIFEESIA